jgi:hypothetical protein
MSTGSSNLTSTSPRSVVRIILLGKSGTQAQLDVFYFTGFDDSGHGLDSTQALSSSSPYRSSACPSGRPPPSRGAGHSAPTLNLNNDVPWQRCERGLFRCRSCGRHQQRSYSDHDTQECGVASFDWNSFDDGCSHVEFCLHLSQCAAGLGSCRDAVPVIHLCVWLLQCGCVLLRVPPGAVVVILVKLFPGNDSAVVIRAILLRLRLHDLITLSLGMNPCKPKAPANPTVHSGAQAEQGDSHGEGD